MHATSSGTHLTAYIFSHKAHLGDLIDIFHSGILEHHHNIRVKEPMVSRKLPSSDIDNSKSYSIFQAAPAFSYWSYSQLKQTNKKKES